MYYFAKLIEYNDIESLERRVLVCAYEDVGLANPNACMRTVAAFQAARTVGFPEARIPIASAIIDLCLSPKSKSSEAAIDAALASLRQQSLPAPEYLRLTPVGLEEDENIIMTVLSYGNIFNIYLIKSQIINSMYLG